MAFWSLSNTPLPLPTLDIGDYPADDEQAQNTIAGQIGAAFEQYGAFFLKKPTTLQEHQEEFMTAAQHFFSLPDEVKQRYERPKYFGERGYIGKQRERISPNLGADLKEFYSFGKEIPSYETQEQNFFPNIWPTEVPQIQNASIQLYNSLETVSQRITQAIAVYFSVPKEYLHKETTNANHTLLRALHYYPLGLEEMQTRALRTASHTDINLFSFIVLDQVQDFAVQYMNKWYSIPMQTEVLLVMVGDMLERLTNKRCTAMVHRVINPRFRTPEREKSSYVIAFYVHPHEHMDLIPFYSCVDQEHPSKYERISAGALLDERLRELQLKF